MIHAPTNAGLGANGGEWSDRLIVRTARFATWLAVTYRVWKSRRELGRLERFDDRLLRDIGVERADIDWARAQPWPIDATEALAGEKFLELPSPNGRYRRQMRICRRFHFWRCVQL
jgi:uncharacterized protein YjiS (DUF1127 family)